MTGTNRPFAHLPRAVDEPAQVRALLEAVGADWKFAGKAKIVEFRLGDVLEVHNANGGSIGVATITGIEGSFATGLEVTARFDPWHDFSQYEPKYATEPEPE